MESQSEQDYLEYREHLKQYVIQNWREIFIRCGDPDNIFHDFLETPYFDGLLDVTHKVIHDWEKDNPGSILLQILKEEAQSLEADPDTSYSPNLIKLESEDVPSDKDPTKLINEDISAPVSNTADGNKRPSNSGAEVAEVEAPVFVPSEFEAPEPVPSKNPPKENPDLSIPRHVDENERPNALEVKMTNKRPPENVDEEVQSSDSSNLNPAKLDSNPYDEITQEHSSASVDLSRTPGEIPSKAASSPIKPARNMSFRIPNATVGEPYSGELEVSTQTTEPLQYRISTLPEGLAGLLIDETSNKLVGTPTIAGEHDIGVQWTLSGTNWHDGVCKLIVNPDPRSLWKVLEPPLDDPYYKNNLDSRIIADHSELKILAASRRGRSHEHAGTFRDDDFYIGRSPSSNWDILIVADGAGSASSSRWGSKLAVEAAGNYLMSILGSEEAVSLDQAIKTWTTDQRKVGEEVQKLFRSMTTAAIDSVEKEALSKNVSAKDYSTTLLVVITKQYTEGIFIASFWVGDGAIVAYDQQGKVRLMGRPDSGEFAGQTRFLDRSALSPDSFASRVAIGLYPDLLAIILMTDGVSDPIFETDVGLQDKTKWGNLWEELTPLLTSEEPDKEVLKWLDFFSPGNHDDRTIALMW